MALTHETRVRLPVSEFVFCLFALFPSLFPSFFFAHRLTIVLLQVLDLDETLVHCSLDPIPNPDLTFEVPFDGVSYEVHVRKRPFFEHFLAEVSQVFEVVVFTASQKVRDFISRFRAVARPCSLLTPLLGLC